MEDHFCFLEGFDDMVHVIDVETLEIVYMNRSMRERFRYCSHEDYAGKRYYDMFIVQQKPVATGGRMPFQVRTCPAMNQDYLVKNSIYTLNGKKYLIEFLHPLHSPGTFDEEPIAFSGDILHECLHRCIALTDPDESIQELLAFMGEKLGCDRTCIMEIGEKSLAHNSYEWCREGVRPQMSALQNLPVSDIDIYGADRRKRDMRLLIPNIETIRQEFPVTYSILRAQDVTSLVADAIYEGDTAVGLLGFENIDTDKIHLAAPITGILGYFLSAQFKRRSAYRRLQEMSYRDALTGAFNRNALFERSRGENATKPVGIIYGDISGVKLVNDTMGCQAGDRVIIDSYHFLKDALDTELVFRVGGDEFVAAFIGITEEEIKAREKGLRERLESADTNIATGWAWSDQVPVNLEGLMTEASDRVYESKQQYYTEHWMAAGPKRPLHMPKTERETCELSQLEKFAMSTYTDVTCFFHSISDDNDTSYFLFGDMQKNLFYISDNMKKEFGYPSNIISGLFQSWETKIVNPIHKKNYREELTRLLQNKGEVLELRHQVTNAAGVNMWVRGYGLLRWNADKTKPLFFSGRITHQDDSFIVDPLTNFPKESVAIRYLADIEQCGGDRTVIGFSFNSLSEINSTRGRTYGDTLIRDISFRLEDRFSGDMSIYRLDGLRFLAILDPSISERKNEIIEKIRELVTSSYHAHGITVSDPCSFASVVYTPDYGGPLDLIENITSLINVARHDHVQGFLDDSALNLQRIKEISDIALSLGRDVLNGMENFRVVVQPIVSAQTGRIMAGETLMRWKSQGRDVSPAVFIQTLEKDKMIGIAGKWVFEQAVRICRRIVAMEEEREGGPSRFYLTVNISLYQLYDTTFPEFVRSTLERYALDGSHLVVELTESCMDEEPDKLIQFVEVCRSCGIRVALDDFGSGYSSMRVLLQYPSSIIKLDRSLLIEMMDSVDKMSFIRSLVYACHQFGKKVCIEGVETEAQNRLVGECGCDMIQGYYYYRPMETDDIYRLFSCGPLAES